MQHIQLSATNASSQLYTTCSFITAAAQSDPYLSASCNSSNLASGQCCTMPPSRCRHAMGSCMFGRSLCISSMAGCAQSAFPSTPAPLRQWPCPLQGLVKAWWRACSRVASDRAVVKRGSGARLRSCSAAALRMSGFRDARHRMLLSCWTSLWLHSQEHPCHALLASTLYTELWFGTRLYNPTV